MHFIIKPKDTNNMLRVSFSLGYNLNIYGQNIRVSKKFQVTWTKACKKESYPPAGENVYCERPPLSTNKTNPSKGDGENNKESD